MAQNTFFSDIHKELDAKMVPCGKWNLPLFYPGGSVAEHRNTRSGASLFDRSMTGCFQIAGKDCAGILDRIFLRSVKDMALGECRKNALLDENASVVLIFTLCRMQDEDFMLIGESGIADKQWEYLRKAVPEALTVRELGTALAQLALTGSKSADILGAAGVADIPEKGMRQIVTLKDDEGDEFRCIAIHGEFAGETSFHICCNAQFALEVYGALYSAGALPAGIGAWESLRIESGILSPPGEVDGDHSPWDCGLDEWVDMSREFTGKTALAGLEKRFQLCLVKLDRHPASPGTVVELPGNIAAGVVTSSAFCPVAGCAQAICRMDADCGVKAGDKAACAVNGKVVVGEAVRKLYC